VSDTDHADLTRRSFARQADKFDDAKLTLADPQRLAWMTGAIAAAASDRVLDVASGTGHLALALAQLAARVVSFDMTPDMQAKAVAKAAALGLSNVAFARGAAEAMGFADGAFDLATCRFAFHHFIDPAAVLREMARVVKPGGKLAVIDLIAPADPALAERYNHFERLRDPSHTRALRDDELRALFARGAVTLAGEDRCAVDVLVERWLDLTAPDADSRRAILGALDAELAGGAPTGLAPFRQPDGLYFKQHWAIYILTTSRKGVP
jgi:ubiquinone/menaquinone biosynthesis C-methylase UbiE